MTALKFRRALFILAAGLLGVQVSAAEITPKPPRVLMFISDGFWAPEYYEPRAIFDKAGFQITVAGKYADPVRPDRRNWDMFPSVKPDVTFDRVDVSSFDAVVFAGGNGAWEDFFPNDDIHRILTAAFAQKKTVALLCSSTGLLGVVGNYDPGEKDKPYAVVDGDLITGRDPMSATLFGETVARKLTGVLR